LANELATKLDCTIDVIDERDHVGGNCYTERDKDTGVMVHIYGPHIFNTDRKDIWDYVNQFIELVPYTNRVKIVYNGNVYSMPINLHTINQFFGKTFNPQEAKEFIQQVADNSIDEPKNFEEQAMKFIGKDLYKAFFYGYTKKQWGCEPTELPAAILRRLPVRFNYNDNYYANPLQGIPAMALQKCLRSCLIILPSPQNWEQSFRTWAIRRAMITFSLPVRSISFSITNTAVFHTAPYFLNVAKPMAITRAMP
jgi:UDP-galactopyranose mutase